MNPAHIPSNDEHNEDEKPSIPAPARAPQQSRLKGLGRQSTNEEEDHANPSFDEMLHSGRRRTTPLSDAPTRLHESEPRHVTVSEGTITRTIKRLKDVYVMAHVNIWLSALLLVAIGYLFVKVSNIATPTATLSNDDIDRIAQNVVELQSPEMARMLNQSADKTAQVTLQGLVNGFAGKHPDLGDGEFYLVPTMESGQTTGEAKFQWTKK